jgi:hypothetical protein
MRSLMSTERLKRIIAREGFIILGVLVTSGMLLWMHNLIPYDDSDSSYVYFCSTAGKQYAVELKDERHLFSDKEGHKILTALHEKYPKDFSPDKGGQYRLPRDFKIDYAKVKFSLPGRIKNTASSWSLFLLFVAYPIYLLFRFIGWAIRLLIEE